MWHFIVGPFIILLSCSLGRSFGAPVSSSSLSSPYFRCRVTKPIINTPHGPLTAFKLENDVIRITLPYAQPPVGPLRFANPQPVINYTSHDATKTPPSCYQGDLGAIGGNAVSEDCLYSTYYIPFKASTVETGKKLPILVWVHGGSGIAGSSTAAGLDGSVMAAGQEAIVVILQYRLGLFGWLQTSETIDEATGGNSGDGKVAGNQAIRDVIMALQQVKEMAKYIGGDESKIALKGQSSGASMVRALLATSTADDLFSHAVIVSDTADYGLSTISDNSILGDFAMEQLGCELSDLNCAREVDADAILQATYAAYSVIPQTTPGIAGGTPWRAMRGSLVTGSINDEGFTSNKHVIMSTVSNEAGAAVSYQFEPSPAGATNLIFAGTVNTTCNVSDALNRMFNNGRGLALSLLSTLYSIGLDRVDGVRETVETTATDGLWRCPTQSNAVTFATSNDNSGNVWLAQWNVGATYPSNQDADYCNSDDGHVCHEDDIYAIFGTAPQPSDAYAKLSSEWRARIISFVNSDDPNPSGLTYWPPVQDESNLNMLSLGVQGDSSTATSSIQSEQRPQACQQVWGKTVKYDWQMYKA